MYTVIAIIIVIASILLTLVVLVQNSKGGGLAANFAAGNQTFGVRQTADFLEKATWTLAIVIIALCILATAFVSTRVSEVNTHLMEQIENAAPVQGQPQFPVDPVAQPVEEVPAATEATPAN
ncbi:MAG: preprotein translocase subunit SecG [Bacteroidales bacterium]|nr:preprotein translocase subunit SecG [Bacteroidales bacterium]